MLLGAEWREWTIDAGLGEWGFGNWRGLLAGDPTVEEVETLRRATRSGEPLGSERFVKQVEFEAGRKLKVLARGRPSLELSSATRQTILFE